MMGDGRRVMKLISLLVLHLRPHQPWHWVKLPHMLVVIDADVQTGAGNY